jgi:NAD(P)H-dependent FMN reductase
MSKADVPALNLILFLSSVREGRFGTRVGKFVGNYLTGRGHRITVFDPKVEKFPMLEKPLHFYQPNEAVPQWLSDWDKKLRAADGFVIVSCEYNYSIPPALSNAMDHFGPNSWSWRPSVIITYSGGPIGGARAAMQLRAYLGGLGCNPVSSIVNIREVQQKLDEEGNPLDPTLLPILEKSTQQFEWHANALKEYKEKHGTPY